MSVIRNEEVVRFFTDRGFEVPTPVVSRIERIKYESVEWSSTRDNTTIDVIRQRRHLPESVIELWKIDICIDDVEFATSEWLPSLKEADKSIRSIVRSSVEATVKVDSILNNSKPQAKNFDGPWTDDMTEPTLNEIKKLFATSWNGVDIRIGIAIRSYKDQRVFEVKLDNSGFSVVFEYADFEHSRYSWNVYCTLGERCQDPFSYYLIHSDLEHTTLESAYRDWLDKFSKHLDEMELDINILRKYLKIDLLTK